MKLIASALCLLAFSVQAAYDIGKDLVKEDFWASDPVLFVNRHQEEGFRFTSDSNESADSRIDGAVTFNGIAVYETKVSFVEAGKGITKVELVLFTKAGTEKLQTLELENGNRVRTLSRKDADISRDGFLEIVKKATEGLTPEGGKTPKAVPVKTGKQGKIQKSITWPKNEIGVKTSLVWAYSQQGQKTTTFEPGFVRISAEGPLCKDNETVKKVGLKKGIVDNVVHDARGDVYIDGVPMVDQGQKGYCAAAAAERVLKYYGIDVDEHEIAQSADTTANSGTSSLEMKKAVQAIGKHHKLATVVVYGDFEKPTSERISGLVKEVAAYNKAAKKLRKHEITEDMYITRNGNMIMYSPMAVDDAMDAEVLRDMKVNGVQKAKFTRFRKDIREQVNKGIPLFWGVWMGIYPEANAPQGKGGHMRLIIGYNEKKKEVLYTDTWGAGHELKRMPEEWAFTISRCLMYMKPLR